MAAGQKSSNVLFTHVNIIVRKHQTEQESSAEKRPTECAVTTS